MNSFTSIYECTIAESDGAIRFFVSFSDVHRITHKVEVTEQVYREFQDFIKLEKRQRNHDMSTLFRTCFYRTKCKYNL